MRIFKEDGQAIAKTILAQIKASSPRALMAWGAKNLSSFTGSGSMVVPETDQNRAKGILGGLSFKVNGAKLKGFVQIGLHADDSYDISCVKVRGTNFTIVAYHEGIYVDNLLDTLDTDIEGRTFPR